MSTFVEEPTPVESIPEGYLRSFYSRGRDWVPAIIVLVLALVAWQEGIRIFHIERFLLPKPTAIAQNLVDNWSQLWSSGWYTFQEALGGFIVGCSLGILSSFVIARFRILGEAFMPYAIAANAIPIIAFAPILNAWFGIGQESKMAVAAILCYFPVLINMVRGLTSVPPASIELMRSYAASETTIFRRVRLPNSLPYLFSALKVASVLAMIGAIVGEYFGGSQEQLGIIIKNSASLFMFETAWAAIVVACLLGIGFYLAVSLAEHLSMSWHPSSRGASG
jgi:NitT/TauT family transport system permease protein